MRWKPSVTPKTQGTAERCQEISQGHAFFAYPWNHCPREIRTLERGARIPGIPVGMPGPQISLIQGYAKNAYPWLICWHRSAVR
jgi:hypothetical protein